MKDIDNFSGFVRHPTIYPPPVFKSERWLTAAVGATYSEQPFKYLCRVGWGTHGKTSIGPGWKRVLETGAAIPDVFGNGEGVRAEGAQHAPHPQAYTQVGGGRAS